MEFNKAQKQLLTDFAVTWSGSELVWGDFENFLVQFNKVDPTPDPIEELYYVMFKSDISGFDEWLPNDYTKRTKQDAIQNMANIAQEGFSNITYYIPGEKLTLKFDDEYVCYTQNFKITKCSLVD